MKKKYIALYLILINLLSIYQEVESDNKNHISEKSGTIVNDYMLYSFAGLDSVADADNYFKHWNIDSIFISKFSFEGVYLTCFKAVVRESNYYYLKKYDPSEYKSIMAIHTQHSISIDGKDLSFNAKGSIGCNAIPESTKVSIDSKVYSLYSNKKHLGKLIILESIEKMKTDESDTGSPAPGRPRKD